jgi:hypothetical protein
MKKNTTKRDGHGRFSGNPSGHVVKRCVSFDPDLYDALRNYADLYCGGVISVALHECLDKVLNDTMFWDDAAARKEAESAASNNNSTTTNAPITTTARDSSPTIVGNANTTTIVEKNHDKPSRPSRRRK